MFRVRVRGTKLFSEALGISEIQNGPVRARETKAKDISST